MYNFVTSNNKGQQLASTEEQAFLGKHREATKS